MGDTRSFREDFRDYDVLMNEAGLQEGCRNAKRVERLWERAADLVDTPSEITICRVKGKLYIGYHRTLSELTPVQLARLVAGVVKYPDLVNGDMRTDGGEVYLVFLFPVKLLNSDMVVLRLISECHELICVAYD